MGGNALGEKHLSGEDLFKIKALIGAGNTDKASSAILRLCKVIVGDSQKEAQIVTLAEQLPTEWQAKHWVSLICKAEEPNSLSSREGKLLKLVPLEARLRLSDMESCLMLVISSRLKHDSAGLLVTLWTVGKPSRKPALALMRSYAYLQARNWEQALADAKVAAIYSARMPGCGTTWPRAFAAMSSAIEGSQEDNTQAALHMQKAFEGAPGSAEYAEDLERLMRRIPESHCEALQAGGSKALELLLAREVEEALPEFRKARPKYYYYFNWMRERVAQSCGQLPAAVLEKLIRIDATELDMLLTYSKGIKRQAQVLLDVYEHQGMEALSQFRLPLLTWKESEELKAACRIEGPSGPSEPKLLKIEEEQIPECEDLDSMEPIDFETDE